LPANDFVGTATITNLLSRDMSFGLLCPELDSNLTFPDPP
jgi:hypothetical protein